MKKVDLKHNMIVRTGGGRYGIVVIEDATDKNCIKYFYDPDRLDEHGMNPIWCDVDSLDNYNDYEDGLWRTYVDPETNKRMQAFPIIAIYELTEIWKRPWSKDIII